ncbi:MAG: ABC transporter permease [Bryobacteraceae bacterium]
MLQDLRYAFRQLGAHRGFTLLAIVTLALGIGVNTAMFTVTDSVLLRSLPYRDAERLVDISGSKEGPANDTSWLNYRDIREHCRQLEDVAGYAEDVGVVETSQTTQSVFAPRVTPNLFSMLGVRTALGRGLTAADAQPGADPVIVLSSGFWKQTFAGDPRVLGKQVRLHGMPHKIVGVLPDTFRFMAAAPDQTNAVWLPLQPTPEMLKERGFRFLRVLGKTKAGVSFRAAQAELDALAERVRSLDSSQREPPSFLLSSYVGSLTGSVRPAFLALTAALILVLLIACANVANLQLSRFLARQQELAVRAAVGANRLQLARQLTCEGGVISVLGAVLGLFLAWLFLQAIQKLPVGLLPRSHEIQLRWEILVVLLLIAAACTILSSLIPAWLSTRTDPQGALQAASRALGSKGSRSRLSRWLIAGEVSLSVVLLIATGLIFRTLWNLEHAHFGFVTDGITTFNAMPADAVGVSGITLSDESEHQQASVAVQIYAPILAELKQLPAVEGAALVTALPFDGGIDLRAKFKVLGRGEQQQKGNRTRVNVISAHYPRIMGIPLLRGRTILEADGPEQPFVAVVNQSFVKKYFPHDDPLGHQLDFGKKNGMAKPYTIVGVLADTTQKNVNIPTLPEAYLPFLQIPPTSLFCSALLKTSVSFAVRTSNHADMSSSIRRVFRRYAPHYAVENFRTMKQTMERANISQEAGLYLIGSFAALAVCMVMAGMYGVLAQLVSHRQREIALRMAVGATRASVLLMILRQGSILILGGLAAGVALVLVAGRVVRGFLFGVSPVDLPTYLAVTGGLLVIGCAASVVPARRAASIEPMQALRAE